MKEMDVYKLAAHIDADYIDPVTGRVYLIQQYNYARRNGIPMPGIQIIDSTTSSFIGYAIKHKYN